MHNSVIVILKSIGFWQILRSLTFIVECLANKWHSLNPMQIMKEWSKLKKDDCIVLQLLKCGKFYVFEIKGF
jgi:hypothetical protein